MSHDENTPHAYVPQTPIAEAVAQAYADHDARDAKDQADAKQILTVATEVIKVLVAKVQDCEGGTTPPPTERVSFGYTTDNIPDSLAILGYPETGSQFQPAGDWSVPWNDYVGWGVERVCIRCKPDVAKCANNDMNEINKVITLTEEAAEHGIELWVTVWHEPEDDIKRGSFTAAQFRQMQINIANALPKSNLLHPTVCLMAYSTLPSANRNIADYINQDMADAGIEVLAWDYYINEGDQPYFEEAVAYGNSLGLRTAIAEFSADYQLAPEPTRDEDMVDVVDFIVNWCNENDADFLLWFDEYKVDSEPDAVDWRLRTLPKATAQWLLHQTPTE